MSPITRPQMQTQWGAHTHTRTKDGPTATRARCFMNTVTCVLGQNELHMSMQKNRQWSKSGTSIYLFILIFFTLDGYEKLIRVRVQQHRMSRGAAHRRATYRNDWHLLQLWFGIQDKEQRLEGLSGGSHLLTGQSTATDNKVALVLNY